MSGAPLPPLFLEQAETTAFVGNPFQRQLDTGSYWQRVQQDKMMKNLAKGGRGGGGGGNSDGGGKELKALVEENARQHAAFEAKVASIEAELAERRENFEDYKRAVARGNAERGAEKRVASERNDAEHAKLQEEIAALVAKTNDLDAENKLLQIRMDDFKDNPERLAQLETFSEQLAAEMKLRREKTENIKAQSKALEAQMAKENMEDYL